MTEPEKAERAGQERWPCPPSSTPLSSHLHHRPADTAAEAGARGPWLPPGRRHRPCKGPGYPGGPKSGPGPLQDMPPVFARAGVQAVRVSGPFREVTIRGPRATHRPQTPTEPITGREAPVAISGSFSELGQVRLWPLLSNWAPSKDASCPSGSFQKPGPGGAPLTTQRQEVT